MRGFGVGNICLTGPPHQIAERAKAALRQSGPHTIQPISTLPTITDPVVIDGYTQPGASPNTDGPGLGLNTVLEIELA